MLWLYEPLMFLYYYLIKLYTFQMGESCKNWTTSKCGHGLLYVVKIVDNT